MDWTNCIICQKLTSEQLSCPQLTSKYEPSTVYENFLLNAEEFKKLDRVPVELIYVGEWSVEVFSGIIPVTKNSITLNYRE